jgi:expansin (peptidoglycan-binding protein)
VHPSSSVEASATGLHWGNGTWGNWTVRPRPSLSSVSLDYTDSATTETPAPSTYVPGQGYGSPSSTSEAAIPTSETPAAAETSSLSQAPAATSTTVEAEAAQAQAQATSAAGSKRGEATFYGGNTSGGKCSFDSGYTLPAGLFGTALSDSNWANAGNCGACVSVTGPAGNSIKAMITDECPGCGTNHLDLYPDAFKKLADPSKGVIPISWDFVPCGITSPIVLKNKSGTSPYWFSMQVVNSNVAVKSLEVSTDGGKTWKATTRQTYNYFENSAGFGTQTVDVRVTSTGGQTIVVKSVSVASTSKTTASGNFSS